MIVFSFFFFKQKTAYEMRISDWSSDVCSSDLLGAQKFRIEREQLLRRLDAAQSIAAERDRLVLHAAGGLAEGGRQDRRLVDHAHHAGDARQFVHRRADHGEIEAVLAAEIAVQHIADMQGDRHVSHRQAGIGAAVAHLAQVLLRLAERTQGIVGGGFEIGLTLAVVRSEEHTSELQSLMRISYAVFCLKKKK